MKICIMGAGVIGLTTAWWLSEYGHDVTIVERHATTGQETSLANGAQLSYSFVAPLASGETLRKLPALLLSKAAPIRVKPTLDPDFIRWGLDFLRACNAAAVHKTTVAQLALAALSRAELTGLATNQALEFGLKTAGKLILYRKNESFRVARLMAEQLDILGSKQSVLTAEDCLELEPALRMEASELIGGTFNESEQVGDCGLFCHELTNKLRQKNTIRWQMETQIQAPILKDGKLVAIKTSSGEIEADIFILCTGSYGSTFTKSSGFRLPIYPMKGYSITARKTADTPPLRHSVTDLDNKIVFAPLEANSYPVIRAAGIADMVGYDATIDKKRLATIIRLTCESLDIDLSDDLHPWAGLRPATPDSRPIIGWSPVKGLFLNTGHGALGWTLACGSARLTAELINNEPASVNPDWFALKR